MPSVVTFLRIIIDYDIFICSKEIFIHFIKFIVDNICEIYYNYCQIMHELDSQEEIISVYTIQFWLNSAFLYMDDVLKLIKIYKIWLLQVVYMNKFYNLLVKKINLSKN